MGRVQAHRNQQRLHLAQEELLDPASLMRVAFTVRHQPDATLLQQRQHHLVVDAVLLSHQPMHFLGQGVKTLLGVRPTGFMGFFGGQVRRHPNLEELVEVGRHDRQVP